MMPIIPGEFWFNAPIWLALLLPLPWLWPRLRRQLAQRPARLMLRHPQFQGASESPSTGHWPGVLAALWLAALAAVILAMAVPQRAGKVQPLPPPARSIILVVDASPSMQAQDFPVGDGHFISRIDAMKQGLLRFVASRPQDRFSVVVVTDAAGTLVPMTTDHAVLDYWIKQLRAGINGSDTALGDGLALAIRTITAQSQAGKPDPLLVVWTDGFSTGGLMSPAEALSLARAHHIRLYTINLAPVGSTPDDGQPSLAQLAELSGGKAILAGDLAAMNAVADQIKPSQLVPSEQPTVRQPVNLAAGFLILALVLWLLGLVIDARRTGGQA